MEGLGKGGKCALQSKAMHFDDLFSIDPCAMHADPKAGNSAVVVEIGIGPMIRSQPSTISIGGKRQSYPACHCLAKPRAAHTRVSSWLHCGTGTG